MLYKSSGGAVFRRADLVRRAGRHDSPAFRASARAQVNDEVGVADYVQVVFYDNDGGSVVDKALEYIQKGHYVGRMKTYGRLVEYKNGVTLSSAHFAGKFKSLGLTS